VDPRAAYASLLAGHPSQPWWSTVILTASSERQAVRYRQEIDRRQRDGKLPPNTRFLVFPDPADRRVGSGAATLHALWRLNDHHPSRWCEHHRVFLIHCGGDSRRLPQYSLSGKLFTTLPAPTPWGERSTVFDETLMLSTAWVERMPPGVLVASGDVVLTFDASLVDWRPRGVTGVALRQPVEVALQHGVYIADDTGRVYSFLQKPTQAQWEAAGGRLPDGQAALDSGLLYFDGEICRRLLQLPEPPELPHIDLYDHFTRALTGQWKPAPGDHPLLTALHDTLAGTPFWCALVEGGFTHVGTTRSFRRLHTPQGATAVMDSYLPAAELAPGAIAIECLFDGALRVGRGSIAHGIEGFLGDVDIPEDTVVHQVPVLLPGAEPAWVFRVYGVEDDPKLTLSSGAATWFGHPLDQELASLGLTVEEVWDGVPAAGRSLWNARLFVVASLPDAWRAAQWLMRYPVAFTREDWRRARRVSLEDSARWADVASVNDSRQRRQHARWQASALALARSGADIRPLLVSAPGLPPLAAVGTQLALEAETWRQSAPTEGASRAAQAALFLERAGLLEAADKARATAFSLVSHAVEQGALSTSQSLDPSATRWLARTVEVAAPPRIDFAGGWSDTPPFCLDWGGTVLNAAVTIRGENPIRSIVRQLAQPVIRLISEETSDSTVLVTTSDIHAPRAPGDPFAVPCAALRLTGLFPPAEELAPLLTRYGGGLELRMAVRLPLGSGLGTSSILAATLVSGLWRMAGVTLTPEALSQLVLRLEQMMTTGGGWQDQAGGIFPGLKLILTGPGLRQRLRVQPVPAPPDWSSRLVLYYTGIRRVARNLLAQVVSSYLARETSTLQVLHSIKTLALEMAYAMRESDWQQVGALMNRHWELNKVLDPNTTNAPIDEILAAARPYLLGAKLAGAGGGGFVMMIAKDEEAARPHEQVLDPARIYHHQLAQEGLEAILT
jgi:fucokinase